VFNGGALALPAFAAASPPDASGTLHEAIFTARETIRDGDVHASDDAVVSGGPAADGDKLLSAELDDEDG
jgi:hypothetical protein